MNLHNACVALLAYLINFLTTERFVVLKQSTMGYTVSLIYDTGGSAVLRATSRFDSDDIHVMVRIYLDVHHLHGSNVSEDSCC